MKSGREPNAWIQCAQNVAGTDGAHAWWFAQQAIEPYFNRDIEDCHTGPDALVFGFTMARLSLCILYGLIILFMALKACFCK